MNNYTLKAEHDSHFLFHNSKSIVIPPNACEVGTNNVHRQKSY